MVSVKKLFFFAMWMLLPVLFSAGCTPPSTAAGFSIDSRFIEFYNLIGGEQTLGKAIGPMYSDGGKLFQYTENSLMVYDERLPGGERFNFEPVGNSFDVLDSPLAASAEQPGVRYLNGHIIFADFVNLYDQLGGARFVGSPLSDVHLNTQESRYEQYFEKMGFYRKTDTGNAIHLLPYGLIACHKLHTPTGCNGVIADASPDMRYLPQPFLPTVERLGEDFTGAPLTKPYLTANGALEQVYENVVLTVKPNDLRSVGLRNLPAEVGINPQPLAVPITDKLMAFISLDTANNLGHNVPTPFLQYIAEHGGSELAGPPISELFDVNGIRRQCFTTYCLDFDPTAPTQAQIHPAPLGYLYLSAQNYQPAKFNLMVWEARPAVQQGEEQVISVKIYNGTPDQPITNLEPTLEITLSNGQTEKRVFPPTSASGTSYLAIKLPNTSPGESIPYQVCASQPGSEPVCVSDSWLMR